MKIIYSILILGLIVTGCKKDSSHKEPKTKTYLLVKAKYTSPLFESPFEQTYTYDEKNRVIEAKDDLNGLFKYTYDDENRVSTVETYDLQAGNPILFYKDTYTYHDNLITAQRLNVGGPDNVSYSFALNALNQVVKVTNADGVKEFTYDDKGHVLTWSLGSNPQPDTYTYDNKKNPLSMIAGNNVHLLFFGSEFLGPYINNVLTFGSTLKHAFTYNDDGFPVTRSDVANDNGFKVTYEYMIK